MAMLAALGKPLRLLRLFSSDRVCPGVTEAETRSGFLGCEFGGCLDDGTKWVAHDAGIFTVGVVDAPKLMAGLRCRSGVRAHARSSTQRGKAKMYQLHKMHVQSG